MGQGVRATQSDNFSCFINDLTEENKHLVSVKNSDSHDGLISIIVTPQTAPDTSTHKSHFHSEKSARKRDQRKHVRQGSTPLTPQQTKKTRTRTPFSDDDSDSDVQPRTTPPLTPHLEECSDLLNVFGSDGSAFTLSCPPPESPYNPLQTPSFRHSPARPDQPWRFPSPSHPLHSNTRELSLTLLARLEGTPLRGETTATANLLPGIQSSPLSTIGTSTAVATPVSSSSLVKSTQRKHCFDQFSSPLSAGTSLLKRQRIISSPLPFTTRRTTKGHNRHPSDSSEFWFSDERLVPSKTLVPIDPTLTDSFATYESWPSTGVTMISPARPPKRPMELESPIVRSGSLASLHGDLALLEPFEALPRIDDEDDDDDLKEILLSSPDRFSRGKKRSISVTAFSESSPPPKRRKIMTTG